MVSRDTLNLHTAAALVHRVGFLGVSVQGQGLGSIILECPFQLRISCDAMIHVHAQAACSDLPTSGKHSLQHQDMGNATFHSRDAPALQGLGPAL